MESGKARVLVTGGAGFIGGHIAERLLLDGTRVRVLDDLSTGSRSTIDLLDRVSSGRLEFIEGDICDHDCVSRAMRGVTHLVHEAALPSVQRSIEDPRATHEVNGTGTLNLLEAARRERVRRAVFAGSSSVYGDQGESPKSEGMAPHPKSPYALCKLLGESYFSLYHQLYGLPTLTLRYFNVFGPRQNPDSDYAAVIPLFVRALLQGRRPQVFGDGRQTRDFTYVDNVVAANLLALEGKGPDGGILNVACGDRTSLLELLELLGGIIDTPVDPEFRPARSGDVRHSQAEIAQARSLLGFRPTVPLREGLERTVAWYRDRVEVGG